MAKYDDLVVDSEIDDTFILSSIRQLKSGLSIYLFTDRQVSLIKGIMKQKYNVKIKINYDGYCYELIPEKRVLNCICY